jgi:hypothetical protein
VVTPQKSRARRGAKQWKGLPVPWCWTHGVQHEIANVIGVRRGQEIKG